MAKLPSPPAMLAALRGDPTKAFDQLAPFLAEKETASDIFSILRRHKGKIDPRFFRAAMKWFPGDPQAPSFNNLYTERSNAPEAKACVIEVVEQLAAAKGEPKWGYFYMMLRSNPVPGTAPGLLRIVKRAARHGDWRFKAPLEAIDKLDDATALPGLRELAGQLTGKTRTGVNAVIASLEARHPEAKAAGAKKGARGTKALDPASTAGRLVAAGLSQERALAIAALARPRIELTPKAVKSPALGTTRFGGEPDLAPGMAWPHVTCTVKALVDAGMKGAFPPPDQKGKYQVPLAFVAQLSLAELAPHDEAGLLPKTGMLWFFVRPDVTVGEKRQLSRHAAVVLYSAKPGTLTRTKPPPELPKWFRYAPAAVKISHDTPLPPPEVEPLHALAMISSEDKLYRSLAEAGDDRDEAHACLGWAQAAFYEGIPAANEQLLLQVCTESISDFTWGDDGSIFFCIPSAALAKKDFSAAYCIADE